MSPLHAVCTDIDATLLEKKINAEGQTLFQHIGG